MARIFRVRATLNGWQGAPGLATHYFVEDDAPVDTPELRAADVAARVRAAWVPVAAKMPNIWNMQVQGDIDALEPATGELVASYTVTPPALLVGTEGTKFGPAASGMCINWNTGGFVAGRRVRGRTFISPINDGIDANGTPTALHVTAALNMYPIFSGHLTGYPQFCVWHRPVLGAGGSAHIVTGRTCRDSGSVLTSRR